MSGLVESAIRRTLEEGSALTTPSRGARFSVAQLDSAGIVLLLGEKEAWTPLRWDCLEGVVPFLRGRGWVEIGSLHSTEVNPAVLDAYLRNCLRRSTGNY